MSSTEPHLYIIGASARACAQSAHRCDLVSHSVDLFSDLDTQDSGPTSKLLHFPEDILKILGDSPQLPIVYVGGMENQADTLQKLNTQFPILGCDPDVVKDVKSPFKLQEVLEEERLPSIKINLGKNPPLSGVWLRKPVTSTGGQRISLWNVSGRAALDHTLEDHYYFQEYLTGGSYSAICLGYNDAESKECTGQMLSLSRQLIGESWCHAAPFTYCGSVGPVRLTPENEKLIQRITATLARRFKLQGLFGIDIVLNAQGVPHIVEVNPRYTASTEIVERLIGESFLKPHFRAFGWDGQCDISTWLKELTPGHNFKQADSASLPQELVELREQIYHKENYLGKAVIYATQPLTVKHNWDWDNYLSESFGISKGEWVEVGDRPRAGVFIGTGDPICTLLVKCPTETETYDTLRRRAVMLHQDLNYLW